ncbi:hypothetical protein PHPALM_31632 [Phytophthora palmivora]|uniref:CCHC-type domain-containing protein n=1 Tax=Phytophthora palmivora TaxID=4796 RepID=A0A2P4X241_9STRA|nr:hypothetical protein PHPALM_31632 [Phytophthora palmivora]
MELCKEQYYTNKGQLMEADLSDFVTIISSDLGKSVLNWYRTFVAECERDFEYDLRERVFCLKQNNSIHDYVFKFQDLMSQTEIAISEMEERFCFQNGLRKETARKIKEYSPHTLQQAIEIASNFEFAHYSGNPPRAPSKPAFSQTDTGFRSSKRNQQHNKRFDSKKCKNDEWRKTVKCNNCGEVSHISSQCMKHKSKEANRFMSGSVYDVSIFIDNGSSLDGVSEELVKRLDLEVTEHELMKVDLEYD